MLPIYSESFLVSITMEVKRQLRIYIYSQYKKVPPSLAFFFSSVVLNAASLSSVFSASLPFFSCFLDFFFYSALELPPFFCSFVCSTSDSLFVKDILSSLLMIYQSVSAYSFLRQYPLQSN